MSFATAARATLAVLLLFASVPAARAEADAPAAREPADWAAAGDEAAKLLSGYIRIDTTNPPGRELAGAEYLARFFEAEGIPAEIYVSAPERGNVVARLPATHPDPAAGGPILLLSHIDVVPADPDAWDFPPFSGAVEDGIVYGRGALDDKGQGVAHALALAWLHRLGVPRRRDIVFAATASEEAGTGTGADWMVEKHWDALGPPAVVWNEGGVTTSNPLLGERLLNAIATTEKRALWLTLVAEGPGGHGSQPVPDGAVNRIVSALERVQRHPTPLRITPTVAEMMRRIAPSTSFPRSFALAHLGNPVVLRIARGALESNRIVNAFVRDTISLTGLRAGLKHNVIPRRAEAMLDIRLLPDTDAVQFLSWLEDVIDDPQVRVEGVPDPLPPEAEPSPPDNELFVALEAELARELPESLTAPIQTTGGTDSSFFRRKGVPAYGFMPAVLDDEYVAAVHGLNERIPVAELERAVRVTYRTLVRLVR